MSEIEPTALPIRLVDADASRLHVDAIVRALDRRLDGRVEATVIRDAVAAEWDELSAAPVTSFLPILVERRVWERFDRAQR